MLKFLPQNFNDLLCLCIMGAIFTLWILDASYKNFNPDEKVMGATIAFFTLIGQFYYRKAKGE